jgi:glycine/D-amino acid oxidase-like deaminating enzyme
MYPWSKNLYVGSAYRKWGLSNGTAAAMILSDAILEKPNPWSNTYRPNRFSPIANIPRVATKYITRQN